jgi:hypothetical protein
MIVSFVYFMAAVVTLWTTTQTSFLASAITIHDAYVPEHCENIAEVGDHLLIEYELAHSNGTTAAALAAPQQRFYIKLSTEDHPVMKGLKGVCKNGTRTLTWAHGETLDFTPIFQLGSGGATAEDAFRLTVKVVHLTRQDDFQIFAALESNLSLALDMIEMHRGVNAVDEWGQTPLMIALRRSRELMSVVAFLMNTRRPMVDVNLAKASGHTALFYAVEHAPVDIMTALLRRGADPNVASIAEGSRGNTPLHYACFLEKPKHADTLLEYGANPYAKNEHGLNPFQLIPKDAVRSTKLHFQRVFQEAEKKLSTQIGGGGGGSGGLRQEL